MKFDSVHNGAKVASKCSHSPFRTYLQNLTGSAFSLGVISLCTDFTTVYDPAAGKSPNSKYGKGN